MNQSSVKLYRQRLGVSSHQLDYLEQFAGQCALSTMSAHNHL